MKVRAEAESDLNDIRALRSNLPFNRYWMREPAQRIQKLSEELTDPERTLSEADRNKKLGEIRAWRQIASKLTRDEAGNLGILGLNEKDADATGEGA